MTIYVVNDAKTAIAHRLGPSVCLFGLGVAVSWLPGCGGGHAAEPVTLVSVTVTPANASVQEPATQQFTAAGTFSDASTQDITKSVSWTSSDTSKATIQNSGLATVVAVGSVTITAASGGKTGTATLAISAATLTSV